jgi:diguanylate cyclase (GGDEF)-like protein
VFQNWSHWSLSADRPSAVYRSRRMHWRDVLLLTVLFILSLLCLGSIATNSLDLDSEQRRINEMIGLSENALILNAKAQQVEQAKASWLFALLTQDAAPSVQLGASDAAYRGALAEFKFALNSLAASTPNDLWTQELIHILRRESDANAALYAELYQKIKDEPLVHVNTARDTLATQGQQLSESVSALVQTLSLNFSRKAKQIDNESVKRSHEISLRLIVLIITALLLMLILGWLLSASSRRIQSDMDVLEREALTDPLTAMPNVRAFKSVLKKWMQRSRRKQDSLTLVLIDLDHFKSYNDTHGHPAGDRLLTSAASAWSAVLPERAFLARIGGEEFGLILPATTSVEAEIMLRNMSDATPDGQTFSAGISLYTPDEDPTSFVARADRALYRAKREGRNRVSGEASTSRPSQLFTTFNMA